MRLVNRRLRAVSLSVGGSETWQCPQVEGRILALGLHLWGQLQNSNATQGRTVYAHDVLRCLGLVLEDRQGRTEFDATAWHAGLVSELMGATVYVRGSTTGGSVTVTGEQGLTLQPGGGATIEAHICYPYVDRRRPGRAFDLVREDDVLGALTWKFSQCQVSDVTWTNAALEISVSSTPDLQGHAGLRRAILVQQREDASYILDGGGPYRVTDLLWTPVYEAGVAVDLESAGSVTIRVAGEPVIVDLDALDAFLLAAGYLVPATALPSSMHGSALQLLGHGPDFSLADTFAGEIALDWNWQGSQVHELIYVRIYPVDHAEVVGRYPVFRGVPRHELARIVEVAKKVSGAPAEPHTQAFTPFRVRGDVLRRLGGGRNLRTLNVAGLEGH